MNKIILDESKILKEVIKCEKALHKTHPSTNFTTKGYVKLIVNIIEEELNEIRS